MRLRILHIIPNFGPGGAERLVVDLMEAMDKERFEVAAVSLYPPSDTILEKEIEQKGLNVFFLHKRKGLDLKIVPSLFQVILSFRPHVVHTHRYALRYAFLPTLLGRVPIRVHTLHNVAQNEVDAVGKWVHRLAFRWLGVVPVSISSAVAETVKMLYGSSLNTPVIYNGIPTSRFLSVRLATIPREKLRLLHIGRFAPQKNHLLLLEGYARALAEYPSMELWLVGDGSLQEEVEKQVQLKGLQEYVKFLGLRKDIPELMNQSDVLLLPSDWEGVPLVVLEAMTAGKPIIATQVGGVPELVEEGVTGLLVPPRDPDALAAAILRLAREPKLIEQMGQAGRRRALERFDIHRTAGAYEELYLKLFEAKRKKGYA